MINNTNNLSPRELIVKLLAEKMAVKKQAFENTQKAFVMLKKVLENLATELSQAVEGKHIYRPFKFVDKGMWEIEFTFGSDVLIFTLHTNVFEFDKSHNVWKTKYVKDNNYRSFCGIIYIYNFLADSFQYNRVNDLGYLIGRIFINSENHYFLEGKRQLGFLFNDFSNSIMDEKALLAIAESAILYSIDFDLLTPPYESVQQIAVQDVLESRNNMQIKTGKRLGFRFQKDEDQVF